MLNEMNDSNEKTLERLDGDLKRIKTSIGRVEGQLSRIGRDEEEGEAMQEEVRLL